MTLGSKGFIVDSRCQPWVFAVLLQLFSTVLKCIMCSRKCETNDRGKSEFSWGWGSRQRG